MPLDTRLGGLVHIGQPRLSCHPSSHLSASCPATWAPRGAEQAEGQVTAALPGSVSHGPLDGRGSGARRPSVPAEAATLRPCLALALAGLS